MTKMQKRIKVKKINQLLNAVMPFSAISWIWFVIICPILVVALGAPPFPFSIWWWLAPGIFGFITQFVGTALQDNVDKIEKELGVYSRRGQTDSLGSLPV